MSFKKSSNLVLLIKNSYRSIVNSNTQVCKPKVTQQCCTFYHTRKFSTETEEKLVPAKQEVSKAMQAYLERSQAEEKFMTEQIAEYEIGKRHLANMMGENPETFTQKDVDEAIAYLLPSGLMNPPARPRMQHPNEIFQKRKSAEFDIDGRPFSSLFYTGKPNYYKVLQEISIRAAHYDQKTAPTNDKKKGLAASMWIIKTKLEQIFLEKLTDVQYDFFIRSMERLINHPNVSLDNDSEFFMKYRSPIKSEAKIEIPPLMYTDAGVPYMTGSQRRKMAFADVTVYGKGEGKITINGDSILYFENPYNKDQVLFPLQFTSLLGLVDVEATVSGGGTTGQSSAIRQALSLALRSFVDADMRENMRLAGLLTYDLRRKERKKPGQKGARAKFTWRKR